MGPMFTYYVETEKWEAKMDPYSPAECTLYTYYGNKGVELDINLSLSGDLMQIGFGILTSDGCLARLKF